MRSCASDGQQVPAPNEPISPQIVLKDCATMSLHTVTTMQRLPLVKRRFFRCVIYQSHVFGAERHPPDGCRGIPQPGPERYGVGGAQRGDCRRRPSSQVGGSPSGGCQHRMKWRCRSSRTNTASRRRKAISSACPQNFMATAIRDAIPAGSLRRRDSSPWCSASVVAKRKVTVQVTPAGLVSRSSRVNTLTCVGLPSGGSRPADTSQHSPPYQRMLKSTARVLLPERIPERWPARMPPRDDVDVHDGPALFRLMLQQGLDLRRDTMTVSWRPAGRARSSTNDDPVGAVVTGRKSPSRRRHAAFSCRGNNIAEIRPVDVRPSPLSARVYRTSHGHLAEEAASLRARKTVTGRMFVRRFPLKMREQPMEGQCRYAATGDASVMRATSESKCRRPCRRLSTFVDGEPAMLCQEGRDVGAHATGALAEQWRFSVSSRNMPADGSTALQNDDKRKVITASDRLNKKAAMRRPAVPSPDA